MDFTFELASDVGYFRKNLFSMHYFDVSLFEQLSLGVIMQGLKGSFCSTSTHLCSVALLHSPYLICVVGNFS